MDPTQRQGTTVFTGVEIFTYPLRRTLHSHSQHTCTWHIKRQVSVPAQSFQIAVTLRCGEPMVDSPTQNYLLAELANARGSVALAELRAVFSQDKGAMSILGPRELERIQDKALPQRVSQVLLRTYNVSDSHLRIIHCEGTNARKKKHRWGVFHMKQTFQRGIRRDTAKLLHTLGSQ